MTKAKKLYTCNLCQMPITPGMDYIKKYCLWNGENEDFYTVQLHCDCDVFSEQLLKIIKNSVVQYYDFDPLDYEDILELLDMCKSENSHPITIPLHLAISPSWVNYINKLRAEDISWLESYRGNGE